MLLDDISRPKCCSRTIDRRGWCPTCPSCPQACPSVVHENSDSSSQDFGRKPAPVQ